MNVHDDSFLRFAKRLDCLEDVFAGECPTLPGQFCNHRPLEALIQIECLFIVAQVVGEYGQCQLRRAAAAVAPFKSGRTVVIQVQSGIERTAVHGDINGVKSAESFVGFHAILLSVLCCLCFLPALRLRISVSALTEMRNVTGGGWKRTCLSKRVVNSRVRRFISTTAAHSLTRITRHNLPSMRITSFARSRNGCCCCKTRPKSSPCSRMSFIATPPGFPLRLLRTTDPVVRRAGQRHAF